MPEAEAPAGDALDTLLDTVESGARAGGARPYLLDYVETAKSNIFERLVTAPPTFESLLRVWGAACGLAEIERDNREAIEEGKKARQFLNQEAPASAGQAGEED